MAEKESVCPALELRDAQSRTSSWPSETGFKSESSTGDRATSYDMLDGKAVSEVLPEMMVRNAHAFQGPTRNDGIACACISRSFPK